MKFRHDDPVLDAEAALLGALIEYPEQLDQLAGGLTTDAFYSPTHRLIFGAMLSLNDDREPIDDVTIRNRCPGVSVADIAELTERCPTAANLEHYVAIIQEAVLARRMASVALDMTDPRSRPRQTLESSSERLIRLLGETDRGFVATNDATEEWMRELERAKDGTRAVQTHIGELDSALGGGFFPSELTILAARPSVGKTAMMLTLARNLAYLGKKSVAIYSHEMTRVQLMTRLYAAEASVDATALRLCKLSGAEMDRILAAQRAVKAMKIWINESSSMSPISVRAGARALNAKHPIDCVMLDYLQLLTGDPRAPRAQQVGEAARHMKELAKELDVPVICLAQLNRASEQRNNPQPQQSDLRESGDIENHADVIMFLYREKEEEAVARYMYIGKQRNGPAGIKLQMRLAGMYGKFHDFKKV